MTANPHGQAAPTARARTLAPARAACRAYRRMGCTSRARMAVMAVAAACARSDGRHSVRAHRSRGMQQGRRSRTSQPLRSRHTDSIRKLSCLVMAMPTHVRMRRVRELRSVAWSTCANPAYRLKTLGCGFSPACMLACVHACVCCVCCPTPNFIRMCVASCTCANASAGERRQACQSNAPHMLSCSHFAPVCSLQARSPAAARHAERVRHGSGTFSAEGSWSHDGGGGVSAHLHPGANPVPDSSHVGSMRMEGGFLGALLTPPS